MSLFSDTDSVCFRKLKNILDHESYIYQGSKFLQLIKLHSIKCVFTNLKDYFYYQKVRDLCPYCFLNHIFIRFYSFFNDFKQAFKKIVSLK